MSATPITVSQGYEVLRPKTHQAYPVPCNEWDVLRQQIEQLTTDPWFFQTAGSLLLGVALAMLTSILVGAVAPSPATPNAIVIGWAITAVSTITGCYALFFAHKERGVHRAKATLVVVQMKLIEERFERGA
jgi:hypothetical protein